MSRLNNKGQSLVLFVVMVPVLIGIIALVYDLGNAFVKKSEIDSVIEDTLLYGIDTGSEFFEYDSKDYFNEEIVIWKDNLKELLSYNLKGSSDISFEDKIIIISASGYVDGIFSNILGIKGFKVESKYKGYLDEDGKEVIEKIK